MTLLYGLSVNLDPSSSSPQNGWVFAFLQCTVIQVKATGPLGEDLRNHYHEYLPWYCRAGLLACTRSSLSPSFLGTQALLQSVGPGFKIGIRSRN